MILPTIAKEKTASCGAAQEEISLLNKLLNNDKQALMFSLRWKR